jgi:serine/threonine protein kinase
LSGEGAILGTLQYMSPEQLDGKDADERSDIFAFGCVLFEMITGNRAFAGATPASVAGAIMSGEPSSMTAAQPLAPAALDRLVRQCLESGRAISVRSRHQASNGVAPDSGRQHAGAQSGTGFAEIARDMGIRRGWRSCHCAGGCLLHAARPGIGPTADDTRIGIA